MRVVGSNKAEPLDCPLTNGKARAIETFQGGLVCFVQGEADGTAEGEFEVSRASGVLVERVLRRRNYVGRG